jgi:DNA-binding NarL/FixJ family response regulator
MNSVSLEIPPASLDQPARPDTCQPCDTPVTILIVEDHSLLREGWAYIFNNDPRFSVIGECDSGEKAIELAGFLAPDMILMDINLPGMNGIEATRLICKNNPASKLIGVSLYEQPAYAKKMMQNGASGYVTKNSPREELFEAIQNVLEGKKYICKEVKNILSDQVLTEANPTPDIASLSAREREVIAQVIKGKASKEIAGKLKISVKTVEVHRYNILRKLNLRNAAALVNFIHSSGWKL